MKKYGLIGQKIAETIVKNDEDGKFLEKTAVAFECDGKLYIVEVLDRAFKVRYRWLLITMPAAIVFILGICLFVQQIYFSQRLTTVEMNIKTNKH
jgi:hypothetical protein